MGKEPLIHNETVVRPTAVIGDDRAAVRVRHVGWSMVWNAMIPDRMLSFVRSAVVVVGVERPPDTCSLEQRLQMTAHIRYR